MHLGMSQMIPVTHLDAVFDCAVQSYQAQFDLVHGSMRYPARTTRRTVWHQLIFTTWTDRHAILQFAETTHQHWSLLDIDQPLCIPQPISKFAIGASRQIPAADELLLAPLHSREACHASR